MKKTLLKNLFFIIILTLCLSSCSGKSKKTDPMPVTTTESNIVTEEITPQETIDVEEPSQPEADIQEDKEPAKPNTDIESPDTGNSEITDDISDEEKVATYVTQNGATLEADFETRFLSATGISCDCSIIPSGTTVVINCNISGLNDLAENEKTKIKLLASSMKPTAMSVLTEANNNEPAITGMYFNVCEEDGDLITTVSVSI